MSGPKIKHSIDIETFGFVTREKQNGKTVIYRCGRDFLYYALHFFAPNKYNASQRNPQHLEQGGAFGLRLPSWLLWTMLQFYKVPKLLKQEGLQLTINDKPIYSWWSMATAMLTPKPPRLEDIEKAIDYAVVHNEVIGVDVSLSLGGFVDHILFIYGYNDENVYLFDTNKVPYLEYEKITDDDRFIMRLPKQDLNKRLGRLSRIWRVARVSY